MGKWLSKQFNKKEMQMADKYMKKMLKNFSHKGNAIKITLRSHLIPVRMAIIKKTNSK
jgi:hypothetical protein